MTNHSARRRLAAAAAALGGALVAGCSASAPTGPICTANIVVGLSVKVTNGATGAPIDSAAVTATDGAYVATAPSLAVFGGVASLAAERPGTYAVSVRKSGYAPWDTTGVRVSKTVDGCHVQPVIVAARLTTVGG